MAFSRVIKEEKGKTEDVAEESKKLTTLEELVSMRNRYTEKLPDHILNLADDPSFNMEETDLRFQTAIRLGALRHRKIAVVGAGGIGTWVVRVLVGMGARNLTVIDDDVVEVHNVGPQSHNIADIGKSKVQALMESMLEYKGTYVKPVHTRIKKYQDIYNACGGENPNILITAVDNMNFRNMLGKHVLKAVYNTGASISSIKMPDILIDLRMGLGMWNAFVLPLAAMRWYYERDSELQYTVNEVTSYYEAEALFDDSEGVQEACTERAIVYTGANIGSYVGAMLHWINDNPLNSIEKLQRFLSLEDKNEAVFRWMRSFNSRDWTGRQPGPATNPRLMQELVAISDQKSHYQREHASVIASLHKRILTEDMVTDVGVGKQYGLDVKYNSLPTELQLSIKGEYVMSGKYGPRVFSKGFYDDVAGIAYLESKDTDELTTIHNIWELGTTYTLVEVALKDNLVGAFVSNTSPLAKNSTKHLGVRIDMGSLIKDAFDTESHLYIGDTIKEGYPYGNPVSKNDTTKYGALYTVAAVMANNFERLVEDIKEAVNVTQDEKIKEAFAHFNDNIMVNIGDVAVALYDRIYLAVHSLLATDLCKVIPTIDYTEYDTVLFCKTSFTTDFLSGRITGVMGEYLLEVIAIRKHVLVPSSYITSVVVYGHVIKPGKRLNEYKPVYWGIRPLYKPEVEYNKVAITSLVEKTVGDNGFRLMRDDFASADTLFASGHAVLYYDDSRKVFMWVVPTYNSITAMQYIGREEDAPMCLDACIFGTVSVDDNNMVSVSVEEGKEGWFYAIKLDYLFEDYTMDFSKIDSKEIGKALKSRVVTEKFNVIKVERPGVTDWVPNMDDHVVGNYGIVQEKICGESNSYGKVSLKAEFYTKATSTSPEKVRMFSYFIYPEDKNVVIYPMGALFTHGNKHMPLDKKKKVSIKACIATRLIGDASDLEERYKEELTKQKEMDDEKYKEALEFIRGLKKGDTVYNADNSRYIVVHDVSVNNLEVTYSKGRRRVSITKVFKDSEEATKYDCKRF